MRLWSESNNYFSPFQLKYVVIMFIFNTATRDHSSKLNKQQTKGSEDWYAQTPFPSLTMCYMNLLSLSLPVYIYIIKSRQQAVNSNRGVSPKLEVPVIHASWKKPIILQFLKKKNLISVCLAWLKSNQNSSPQSLHGNHVLGRIWKHCPERKNNSWTCCFSPFEPRLSIGRLRLKIPVWLL